MSDSEFSEQVARTLMLLYEAHPRIVDINAADAAGRQVERDTPEYDAAVGTLVWLHRNGFVTANYDNNYQLMLAAQLSPRSYAILRGRHQNVSGTFAEAIRVAMQSQPGREFSTLSELLVSELT